MHPRNRKAVLEITAMMVDQSEDEIRYCVSLSNERYSSEIEFWGQEETFQEFASNLSHFPKSIHDTATFAVGEKSISYPFYMSLTAYCFDKLGHTALEFDVVVNEIWARNVDTYETRFSVKAEAASLNKLGITLSDWNPRATRKFTWTPYFE